MPLIEIGENSASARIYAAHNTIRGNASLLGIDRNGGEVYAWKNDVSDGRTASEFSKKRRMAKLRDGVSAVSLVASIAGLFK